jgi:hypothetical protein
MTRQWAEPSWSSRTNPAHQAQPGSGQPSPLHLLLSHSTSHARLSYPDDVAAAAWFWLVAGRLWPTREIPHWLSLHPPDPLRPRLWGLSERLHNLPPISTAARVLTRWRSSSDAALEQLRLAPVGGTNGWGCCWSWLGAGRSPPAPCAVMPPLPPADDSIPKHVLLAAVM